MLEELYQEIAQRQKVPKESSYTNYLFSKGLDKILKKVGEEATEVVIAAKNRNETELVNEVSDLTYHLLVLLVEQGVPLAKIEAELSARQNKMSQFADRQAIDEY